MKNELKNLLERFETEIWLYIDGTMPEENKNFWEEKMNEFSELRDFYNETAETIKSSYSAGLSVMDEEKFSLLVDEAVADKSLFRKIEKVFGSLFNNLLSPNFTTIKIAAVSLLSAAAVVLLLTTEGPNAVKNISRGLLDWEGSQITVELREVNNSIDILSKTEWEKYYLMNRTGDAWDKSIYSIREEMQKLQEDINNNSL